MGATRGLIRQKDKIESGRRQRSERPTCIRFADYLLTMQAQPDPSQSPTMHSGATRGPYSPKTQNLVLSAQWSEPAGSLRFAQRAWLRREYSDVSRDLSGPTRAKPGLIRQKDKIESG